MKAAVPDALVDLKEYLADRRRQVDRWLESRLPAGPDYPPELAAAMRYGVLTGGKRLRPILVLMASEVCGGSETDAQGPAVAVELVHAYSLMHDDLPCMDDDELRRGRPSVHVMFGEALAVLAGDALLTQAFSVLVETIEDAGRAARCVAELAWAAGPGGLVGGQCRDLLAMRVPAAVSPPSAGPTAGVEAIHRAKTAALIRASLRLGALVAGADGQALEALSRYGEAVGLAFQIADDLLGLGDGEAAPAAATGKPVGKDADRGKLTYPRAVGVEASRRRARQLAEEACQGLALFDHRADRLRTLARYIVERDR